MRLSKAALVASAAPALAVEQAPTALRKQAPDSNFKILAHHLAFAPLDLFGVDNATLIERFEPPFGLHEPESSIFQRAAVALSLLQRRSACPTGMSSCDAIGAPNKCCSAGTTCTSVDDSTVGHVACCPDSSSCGGSVGKCPSGAVTCPAELGGGCCIPGYVCQGVGCVPSASASATQVPPTSTKTVIQTQTNNPGPETITKTETIVIGGSASTVIVTQVVTRTESEKPTTKTTTQLVTKTGTVTGGAPWRPIGTTSGDESTSSQEGCPTGFYGCLATHGGGCCRTDRSCQTYSCPPQDSTTVVSGSITLVVPVTNAPAQTTGTCADGWFMCGADAGPVAGCCPSGYNCGTASCFADGASQSGSVQKHLPGSKGAAARADLATWPLLGWAAVAAMLL